MRKVFFGLLLAGGLIVFLVAASVISTDARDEYAQKAAPIVGGIATTSTPLHTERQIQTSIPSMQRQYEENEVSADQEFKGRNLVAFGQVLTIEKNAWGNIVLEMGTDKQFKHVRAFMTDGQDSAAAELHRGQMIALACKGSGMMLGSANLTDCRVSNYALDDPPQFERNDFTPEQWSQLGVK